MRHSIFFFFSGSDFVLTWKSFRRNFSFGAARTASCRRRWRRLQLRTFALVLFAVRFLFFLHRLLQPYRAQQKGTSAQVDKTRTAHHTHKFNSKCEVLTGVARKVTTDRATPSSPRLLLLQTFRFRAHMGAVQEGCLIWSCSFHLLPSFSLVLSSCVSAFFPSSNFPLWALLTLSSWLSTAQP